MTLPHLYRQPAGMLRHAILKASDLADNIHLQEAELVKHLKMVDQEKYYLRVGYKSLSGFCRNALRFTKVQTQRIVTQVRQQKELEKVAEKKSE